MSYSHKWFSYWVYKLNNQLSLKKILTGFKKECIYALCVGLKEDNTIPTKPPISKQQSPTQEKQETINKKALSETMLLLK